MDDILDKGGYIGEDIHELLVRMNPNFIRRYSGGEEWLQYKGRSPLYVINYKRTEATEIDQTRYRTLRLVAINFIICFLSVNVRWQWMVWTPKIR